MKPAAEAAQERIDHSRESALLIYDPEDLPCKLCGGTLLVTIQLKSACNDYHEDECPWCLRRSLKRIAREASETGEEP